MRKQSTRDLLEYPLWQPKDLGHPIPGSSHSVSVCLPTWRDTIGYEEHEPRVSQALRGGYPRFVYNRHCQALFRACEARFARADELCLAFPSREAAGRFSCRLRLQTGHAPSIHPFGAHDVHAVCFAARYAGLAKSLWQHSGEGVSSRRAQACLTGCPAEDGTEAKQTLRQQIARLTGVSTELVFLFPCGMNAISSVHRALTHLLPDRKSVQFGFPYVDTLKIQETFGHGAHFFARGDEDEFERLEAVLEAEAISGLYTEFPSNPLLVSPDLERLARLARRHRFPLVVDDTIASFVNVDLLPAADVVCTSLTKIFSGVGNVTGGSVVINPESAYVAELASHLARSEDLLWGADAVVLERNFQGFEARVAALNRRAEALAAYLRDHPKVAEVYYPKYREASLYRAFQRPGGGYGSLLSLTLHDGARTAPAFFDRLRVCKGPNLGTDYTLACPYAILAHYNELGFAESCGVSRDLVRVSVGLEETADLIGRFEDALSAR